LHAGRECHNSLKNSILSEKEFAGEKTKEILAWHDEAWNLCKIIDDEAWIRVMAKGACNTNALTTSFLTDS